MTSTSAAPAGSRPERVDVAVIGGGIVGVSTAFELARRGHSVAVLEKGRIGGEQSGRNWGWCRQQGRDRRELPLIRESLRLWDDMAAATGVDPGFRRCGVLKITDSPKQLAAWEDWAATGREHQIRAHVLSPAAVREVVPGYRGTVVGGLYTPDDGAAEPGLAAPAIARGAAAHGAYVLETCAVRGLDVAGGRVGGVVTEHGRIAADAVVIAAGAWSWLVCGRHDVVLPQLTVRATACRTEPLAAPVGSAGAVGMPGVGLRRRADGGCTLGVSSAVIHDLTPGTLAWARTFWPAFRLESSRLKLRFSRRSWEMARTPRRWSLDAASPFEATRVLEPDPDRRGLDAAIARFRQLLPDAGEARVAQTWAGVIDATPDSIPVIGPVSALPGLHLATGFSGHGFGLGPGAGRLAADLVTQCTPVVDPAPYRHDRMTDGTRLVPEVGV